MSTSSSPSWKMNRYLEWVFDMSWHRYQHPDRLIPPRKPRHGYELLPKQESSNRGFCGGLSSRFCWDRSAQLYDQSFRKVKTKLRWNPVVKWVSAKKDDLQYDIQHFKPYGQHVSENYPGESNVLHVSFMNDRQKMLDAALQPHVTPHVSCRVVI